MKTLIALCALAALLAASALAADKKDRGTVEPREAQQVRATEIAFAAAARAKDYDKAMTFWDSDIHFFQQGKMVTGRDAEMKNWLFLKDPNVTITWSPEVVEASGGLGYTTGPYELHVKQKDGSERVERGRYCTIWRKKPDGSWKAALDIGSPEPPEKKQ